MKKLPIMYQVLISLKVFFQATINVYYDVVNFQNSPF